MKGDIAIDWTRNTSSFSIDVGVPDGSEAEVVLPPGARAARVNGAEAHVMWGADRLARLALWPGRWTVEASMEE